MRNYYTFELSENINQTSVSYPNRYDIRVAAGLYMSKDMDKTAKYPALVIEPPFGSVKKQGPVVYANQLVQRGFVVLAFDPAFMGDSGGEPRHVSSPDIFAENFSAGVDYLGILPYVDREKIGAVGICGSGGFALSAAQVDTRIKAVATASMYDITDGSRMPFNTPEKRAELFAQLGRQRWQDFESGALEYLPSFPEEPAEEVPKEIDPVSAEFFSYYGLKRENIPMPEAGLLLQGC